MTDEQLKSEYLTLYNQIEVAECWSCQDVLRYDLVGSELDKRGFEVVEGQPSFVKREEVETE